jgi:hypothetical protein
MQLSESKSNINQNKTQSKMRGVVGELLRSGNLSLNKRTEDKN